MKRLILSEGKHDTTFLEKLVRRYCSEYSIHTYDIESKSEDDRHPEQTREIRNFKEKYNPYDVFLKSEGGKENLLKVAPKIIKRQSNKDINFDFLIDLDEGSAQDIENKINKSLIERSAGKEIEIQPVDNPNKRTFVITQEFEVWVEKQYISSFNIIFIDPELEQIMGIKDSDSDRVIERKIESGIEDERIREPIIQSLFGE